MRNHRPLRLSDYVGADGNPPAPSHIEIRRHFVILNEVKDLAKQPNK